MTPPRNHSISCCRPGFTLLEIVFVIGMVALLAGMVASWNLSSMLSNDGSKAAFEVFREATHEARIQAINGAQIVYLTFDEEAQVFRLTPAQDAVVELEDEASTLPVFNRYGYIEDELEEEDAPVQEDAPRRDFQVFEDRLAVEFRGVRAEEATGFKLTEPEYTNEALPRLSFHPSGVSTPAVVIMRYSNGDELQLTLDNFSNGPQLLANEGVAP